jgi:DNA mismatch repair protein MutS
MEEAKLTPMIRQYLQIKGRYQDAILFFRLGDFYEMFFEDAERASKVLDIALTSRNRSNESAVPLCGVPYHAATPYIGRLLDAGFKVAICEQVEDPKLAKGVVRREVVRVISPGTITEAESLDARGNNYLVAVSLGKKDYGLAVTDVTTGEFRMTQVPDLAGLLDEIGRIQPSEILWGEAESAVHERLRREFPDVHFTPVRDFGAAAQAAERLKRCGLASDLGEEWSEGARAARAIVSYLEETVPDSLKILRELQVYRASEYVLIDAHTRDNLELLRDLHGEKKGSLLGVLDRTQTPMGARLLRRWILYPLLDEQAIRKRQDGIEELAGDYQERQNLREALKKIQDLERLGGRAASGNATPRDLAAVRETLLGLLPIRERLAGLSAEIFVQLRTQIRELPEAVELIARAVAEDPPATVKNGGFIRAGYHAELDELRALRSDAKDWIARLESRERKRTGINSLKVRYNRVFGYYIEISNANLKLVPDDYMRKQTLVNGERYITPDLKEYETKVLNSEEEILRIETALFEDVRRKIAAFYDPMKQTSQALAVLDVLISLAEAAESCHLTRPKVDSGVTISIREGRHPVVEAALGRAAFVPNDCRLDPDSMQILILTGPNMAGKSTYMRQVALITLMAQMGSFVPAAEAHIGLADRIFTRIGASDSLSRGESTFMVEMKETAHILREMTPRSLILLDEVGRGTSTFDGISIAWSVAEYLHDLPQRPRTLFATHYHELTDLALTKERVKNFTFAVKEWKGEVIFLRSLVAGATNRSYGIHVARLAGLPQEVIERAKGILHNLEGGELDPRGKPRIAGGSRPEEPGQLMLFQPSTDLLREQLKKIDTSAMTPLEALNVLDALVKDVNKEEV